MAELEPWRDVQPSYLDQLKRFVFQNVEEEIANSYPHVLKQLPSKRTVQGMDSPHQMGDLCSQDMLTRAPLYCSTCHFTWIPPDAPDRGAHRHVSAPTLFSVSGKGWEWNDGRTYYFETYDLLIVTPYSVHQHGGNKDTPTHVYVPQSRIEHLLGTTFKEQHKFSEKVTFPEGTEPLYDDERKLVGYRLKKGVLGIDEDVDILLGSEPDWEAAVDARRSAGPWVGEVENTYDHYVKMMHDETEFCRTVDHVVHQAKEPWEWTRQGKLKWLVHPYIDSAAKRRWIYLQDIPAGSRSGKHRHVAEELILVLEGRGYDVHDGQRWDWEQSEMICIPPMTVHQHFALGESRAILISAMPSCYDNMEVGGIEQFEDAPEYIEER